MDTTRKTPGPGQDARLEFLRPGLDSVGLPVCILDSQLVYHYVNQAYCRFYGLPMESFLGRNPEEVFGKPLADAQRVRLRRASDGDITSFDREVINGPSVGRWVRAHYFPVQLGNDVTAALVVLMDIQHLKDTEARLAQRTHQLESVTENVGLPMSYIDAERRFVFTNQPGLDWMPGCTRENVIGKRLDEVFSAEVIDLVRPHFERALAGEPVVYERQGTAPDGRKRWIRVHLVPDVDARDKTQGLYAIVIDIDDDHKLREALSAQEAQFRYFAENLPGPTAFVGPDFRYRFANKVFLRTRGLPAEEIVGHHVGDVMGPDLAKDYVAPFIERLKRGEPCEYERLVGSGDKPPRWHLVRLVPIRNAAGEFDGYYIVGTDIHDIRVAEEQLRLFTENIPESIAHVAADRRYLYVNKAFATYHGKPREEIIGRTTEEVLGEEFMNRHGGTLKNALERGEPGTYERLAERGGEDRWVHVTVVPQKDAEGRVLGVYSVGHDIHALKTAQEAIAAQEEELRFFAENIPEAIVYMDNEKGCTFANNVFLATRGFTREFAMGKFPEDVYPPEMLALLRPHITSALSGEPSSFERVHRLPDGTERWVRTTIAPRYGHDGRVMGYYVVSIDINDVKVAQQVIAEKERELRQVIDSIPTPMVYCDHEGRYRYVNDAFLSYIGLEANQVIGHSVRELLGEDRWSLFSPSLERVRAGESLQVERLIRFADGRTRWMNVRLTPRVDADGRFLGHYATSSDIHEQKMVEQELRRTNTMLSAHFDNTPLAVIEWDTDFRVVRWSGQAEQIFGWSATEALGRSAKSWRLVYEEDAASVEAVISRLFSGAEPHGTLLNRNYRKDGSVIWVEWHNSALRDEANRVISVLSLAQDVSSRIQAEERLQFMATHDGLTGLPNRVLLNDRLDGALARARRAKRRVAVMFLDLDHFKDVNDTLGHRVGDLVLKELSRRLRATLRQSDLLARISGDEFVMVLEDLPSNETHERIAGKVLDEARRVFSVEGNEVHVSASLGLAVYPEDGNDGEMLLKNADAAMYAAKELGRNNFRLYSAELAARRIRRLEMESGLRRALERGELELYYQPIVDLETGAVKRAEALLRWQEPDRGLVLPGTFLPLAEESGLGHEVGNWVFETACRQARAWRDAGLGDIVCCVNISPSQLRDSSLVPVLKRLLARAGCEAAWVQLEITETSMVRDLESVGATLSKLRALGVKIAIDDFGTGFSSLSHLRHLAVDTLKIDKTFVADIDAGRSGKPRVATGSTAIVSAVLGLAKGLGLDVVAEGIEKPEQLAFLARAGCISGQGYLFCAPLPAAEFEKWVRAKQVKAKPAKAAGKAKAAKPKRVSAKRSAKAKKGL
ncbi:sensor domain-containing protein [Usitatibacter palustris]|uniref:PAS domain S-box-containing protein/diguanylate cyclase (GGDEF) domain-containing protein n=1 Tax=Usitatibacter palustris TaxID=2732487 RepID=A0A6M4H4N7_9PROT|nr:PAS domain S-box protein [Usitatibacter palustris]QJR13474.1 hypothetical protein DSM104440_00258 [Usitatibacter palustris]